nr:site-2 protease family protein [Paenibacillus sp. YYML68]
MQQKKENKRKPLWFIGAAAMFLFSQLKVILPVLKAGKAGGAFLTMLLSVGAYALLFPWQFAIGFVLLIFVHELGHVWASKRKGMPVTAVVFIPFFGAMTNMKRYPKDAVTEAYIAMGGPVIGSIGALAVLGAAYYFDSGLLYSLAYTGFFINLLNLLPINPLDGGRISTAVTRWLWPVGLVLGLIVIIQLSSWILLIFWAMFAYDLYIKYVKNRNRGEQSAAVYSFELDAEPLLAQGYIIPGSEHRRELAFHTYTDREQEQQLVEVYYEGLAFRGTVPMQRQSIIHRVQLEGVKRKQTEQGLRLELPVRIDYSPHTNDKYYEVPPATRWKFGLGYAALAGSLLYLMHVVHVLSGIDF